MRVKDFEVSGDTIIWILMMILLLGNFLSYKMGYKDGIQDEKIGWLEDQELKRKEIINGER